MIQVGREAQRFAPKLCCVASILWYPRDISQLLMEIKIGMVPHLPAMHKFYRMKLLWYINHISGKLLMKQQEEKVDTKKRGLSEEVTLKLTWGCMQRERLAGVGENMAGWERVCATTLRWKRTWCVSWTGGRQGWLEYFEQRQKFWEERLGRQATISFARCSSLIWRVFHMLWAIERFELRDWHAVIYNWQHFP